MKKHKKSANKGSVTKAIGYRDGRESDAIGKALRRYSEGGGLGGSTGGSSDNGDSSQFLESYNQTNNTNTGSGSGTGSGNGTGDKTDTTTDKKVSALWDKNGDGKLSAAEKLRKQRLIKKYGSLEAARAALKKQAAQKKKNSAENNKKMNIDNFKEQRAARMDKISDQYNAEVKKLIKEGYPEQDALTLAAYNRAEKVGKVGNKMLNQAKKGATSVMDQYEEAKNYDKTEFGDLEDSAAELSDYDPSEFSSEDYTTESLKSRMSPYEELVAERARQRLKKDFDEGQAELDTQAARAGAFGSSMGYLQKVANRQNYRDTLADYNAESLQKAYESAADLTSRADDSLNRAETAEEQSRQFGSELGMKGWEAQLSARNAGANEVARAKEAELAGIAGQGSAAQLMSGLSAQELAQYAQKTNMMNQYGQQQQDYELNQQEYPLSLMERNMNINTSAVSGTPLNTTPKASQPSDAQRYLGYGMMGASILNTGLGALSEGASLFGVGGAAGGSVTEQGFRRPTINLANGGIVDLHAAMFRRK